MNSSTPHSTRSNSTSPTSRHSSNGTTTSIHPAPLETTRAIIAHTILPPHNTPTQLGNISLLPHQIHAVTRITSAIHTYNGALLADETGLGKTFIALAIAHNYKHPLIIAPATLRTMWHDACQKTNTTHANWRSTQSLSAKHLTIDHHHDLIIVDEAHYARNPKSRRYQTLTALCQNAPVLLITATPIHNTRNDLTTLLSLFLHHHIHTLTPASLTNIVIRRTHPLTKTSPLPLVRKTKWITSPHNPSIFSQITSLPPPTPHPISQHLITTILTRQWISSETTLWHAVSRRIAKASALLQLLHAGRLPSIQEQQRWCSSDHSIQLDFPELYQPITTNTAQWITCVESHRNALRKLRNAITVPSPTDHERARILRYIRNNHQNEHILAFSQYATTIHTLFNLCRHWPHVAATTAHGTNIASGRSGHSLTLQQTIDRFAPNANNAPIPPEHQRISLLLTTDLLAEGVNLQDASVLIHLDLPWTVATLNQRTGRLARTGSPHSHITVYGFHPPVIANTTLKTTTILRRKATITNTTLGRHTSHHPHLTSTPETPIECTEHIHALLDHWKRVHTSSPLHHAGISCCSTTLSTHTAAIALCIENRDAYLLALPRGAPPTRNPKTILTLLQSIAAPAPHHTRAYHDTLAHIQHWWLLQQAERHSGIPSLPLANRPVARSLRKSLAPRPATLTSRLHQPASASPLRNQFSPPGVQSEPVFHIPALLILQKAN